MTEIAIIGAGLAGLTLAQRLSDVANVTVLEKSRGVGGRMATRYADPYEFDHGAQYFTAQSEEFMTWLAPYIQREIIAPWPPTIYAPKDQATQKQRYVGAPRMNSLAKALNEEICAAKTSSRPATGGGVDVRLKTHVARLERDQQKWRLIGLEGELIDTVDWVVSTAPAPQAMALLPDEFSAHAVLESVRMEACFSLMLGFDSAIDWPWPAARFAEGGAVGWAALNADKPGRPDGPSLLLQSTNEWAEAHIDDDPQTVETAMIETAARLAGVALPPIAHRALHRWRYAATPTPAGVDFLLDEENQLAACGDWCLGGKVEAAFLSTHRLGGVLRSRLANV